jgi:long-chain acyl-CoA synthetase
MGSSYDDVFDKLTGPGAPFELVTEEVDGRPTRNFKRRERSLRERITGIAAYGDKTCFVFGERRISYAEFARLVWGTSHNLRDKFGARRGDRLAVLAFNSPEWVISMFGVTSMAGVGVGLNGWWQTDELEYGLSDSGSRYLVVDDRLYPRIEDIRANLSELETIFYIGDRPPAGTVPISELITESDVVPNEPIAEEDPFIILYTSGTTGRSKGCITTHRGTIAQVSAIVFANLVSMQLSGVGILPSDGSQVATLLSSPLFHVGGFHSALCAGLTTGSKLVLLEGGFHPEKVLGLIQSEKINTWPAIPTMLHRVVNHPNIGEYDLSSLRAISFGGAPTAPETIEKAREVFPIEPTMANAYGLTETHGVATVNAGKDLLGKKTAAGRPAPFLDCKIIDERGAEVPLGQLGQVLFYGPTITPGYWNRADATAEAVRNGWLYTGDIGYLDDDGFLFIVDRAKDMILRGGENVYCVEIENRLAEHASVAEAAVIGVHDAELGERVKAIVVLKPGKEVEIRAIRAHVAAKLASFKVPEFVEFRDEPLPRNPAGKILKNELRQPSS